MWRHNFARLFLIAAAILTSGFAFGQGDIQLHARHLPGWDARAREGRCDIHVWVDNRAEVRMRGDQIFVRTLEGANSRDEGSECSQPLPFNSVRDFQIRQTAGRNQVNVAQPPSRMNNYTATMSIVDPQNGGDNYTFEVSWRADADVATAPAPFFDDVRACQETVRWVAGVCKTVPPCPNHFEDFADRQGFDQDRGRGQGRNRDQETIRGRGSARSPNESRDLNYSCIVDTRRNQVISADYQFVADGVRTDDRVRLR